MAKLAVVAVIVLLASCFSTDQEKVPAPIQSGPAVTNERSQSDSGTGEIPTFYSHPRQVLVTASVWKHTAKSTAPVPEEILKRYPILSKAYTMPPIARGLSASDFHIFDDGAEQKINYVEESDFSWRDVDDRRSFQPQPHGTWGGFLSEGVWIAAPTATYTIGYIPPLSQTGDCHTIRVEAGNNEVLLNRTRYCNTDETNTATVDGRNLAAQMENFAKSGKRGSITVSSRPFVFWASRVLSLMRDNNSARISPASAPAANYTYVVVVHDSKAPAIVQIATEYELATKKWDDPCPSKYAAIHVFGIAYKTNGEVAARFGDSYQCRGVHNLSLITFGWDPPSTWGSVTIPSRFNAQIELPPGDYDVHVVVSEGHKFGQARMPVRVETLDGQALTISDIAVNGNLQDASWLLREAAWVSPAPLVPTPLVSKQTQFIPVPDARIPKKTSLPLYFEVYEPLLADHSPETYFRMKITDLKDGTVVMNAGPTSAAQCVTPGNVVIPIALNVDTKKLPSGQYKIEIQASDSAGRTTEWRMAKFEIQ